MNWTVMNQHDGNETFEVEGNTCDEAAYAALQELGWAIVVPDKDDELDSNIRETDDDR